MYNKNNYVVEVHFGWDVFHKDYGAMKGCAERAVERLKRDNKRMLDDVRVWYDGRCVYSSSTGWR